MTYYTNAKALRVHATQWHKNGDHPKDESELITDPNELIESFLSEGKVVRRYRNPRVPDDSRCPDCGNNAKYHGWIDSPVKPATVCPGDYIIDASDGRHFPIKPDLFAYLFQEVTP